MIAVLVYDETKTFVTYHLDLHSFSQASVRIMKLLCFSDYSNATLNMYTFVIIK